MVGVYHARIVNLIVNYFFYYGRDIVNGSTMKLYRPLASLSSLGFGENLLSFLGLCLAFCGDHVVLVSKSNLERSMRKRSKNLLTHKFVNLKIGSTLFLNIFVLEIGGKSRGR